MNRMLERAKVPSPEANSLPGKDAAKVAKTFSPGAAPNSLFLPLHYEKKYSYPLIVWLHGPGDDERQLHRIMPLVSMRNYVAVAPRGTVRQEIPAVSAFSWQQTEEDIALAEQRVLEAVEVAKARFNVNPERIFLAGYADGGTTALRLGLLRPELFHGVISVCGEFPRGASPLMRINTARRLRMLMIYGRDDQDYGFDHVCRDLPLFHTAKLKVDLRQYPCGNEVTTNMLHDVDAWIMKLVTGQPMEEELPHSASVDLN